jgi:tetratricopeptide (TPR) repeat protein
MKKILFPTLLVVTLLAGVAVAFSIWRASPESAEDFLQSGKKYYEEKKYSEATIQLMNAVQKDGRNREALYLLAQSYLQQGNPSGAVAQLRALLEYYPNDVDASLLLGNLYLAASGGDPRLLQEVSGIAQKLLSADPQNVRALILSGNAAAGLRDYETSVETFEKALNLDPQNSAAFVSLGTTQAVRKNFAEAEQAFLKAREVDPKNRQALLSLGNFYMAMREADKAEAVYKDALAQYPEDPGVYGPLSQFYFQQGRTDDAIKLLQDTQARNPKNPRPSFLLSDLYQSAKRPAEARAVLLELKKNLPDDVNLAAKLAANLMRDEPEKSRAEVDQILKAEPKSPIGLLLLGELQYFGEQYDAAQATLSNPLLTNTRFPEVQFFLGNLALRKRQFDVAQDYYQKTLTLNPNYILARAALGGVFLEQGKRADAQVEVRRILDADPTNPAGRLLQASIDRLEKRFSQADAQLQSLLKQQPSNPEIHQQMALNFAASGRAADAEKSFLRALELQPDYPQRMTELVNFYLSQKQPDKAIQRLNAIPDAQKQAFHYVLLGGVYLQSNKPADAEAAYNAALEKDPKGGTADAALASLYIRTGRMDEGLKKLDDLIAKNSSNAGAYTTKGMIYEQQGRIAEAKASYNSALQADPNSDVAANNLAYLLAEEGRDLQTALTWASSARQRQPNSPAIADTLGWVYYKLGNHVLARDQLEFAALKDPAHPVYQYHLGMIYKGLNQSRQAREAFSKAAGSTREFKEKPLAQAALQELRN